MYSEETKSSALAKFLSIYDYAFVDTCSLMEDSFPSFMDTLKASKEYWKDGFEVIVLGECVQELKKNARSKEKQEARIEAKRALKIIRHDRWHGKTLTITKSNSNYGFADNAIFSAVSSLRIQKKVLIITQDRTLATDLRKLNSLDSQRGRYVEVYRLNAKGELEETPSETNPSRKYEGRPSAQTPSKPIGDRRPPFHGDQGLHQAEPKEKAPEPAPISQPITDQDRRLSANIPNPNYPLDRKIADIDAQLASLNALSPETRNRLSLAYTPDQLAAEKAKLLPQAAKQTLSEKTVPEKPSPSPAPSPKESEAKQPEIKQTITEGAPKAEAKTEPSPRKSWFEYGKTVQEALIKCGARRNWIFRDPSVAYLAAIHGPFDITSLDLDAVAEQTGDLKPGDAKDVLLKGLIAHIEKTPTDFKCSLEMAPQPAVVAPKPSAAVPQTVEAALPPKTANLASAPKTVEQPKAIAPIGEKPVRRRQTRAAKPKTAEKTAVSPANVSTAPLPNPAEKKPLSSNEGLAAGPSGATLIVGIPTDKGKKAFLERRSRREETPSVPIAKKEEGLAQAAAKKKPSVKTSAAKKPAPKEGQEQEAAHSPDFAKALKEDGDLNAKLNNPNYPKESAIKDLQAQETLLRKLKPSETKDFHFGLAKIKAKLKELKEKVS